MFELLPSHYFQKCNLVSLCHTLSTYLIKNSVTDLHNFLPNALLHTSLKLPKIDVAQQTPTHPFECSVPSVWISDIPATQPTKNNHDLYHYIDGQSTKLRISNVMFQNCRSHFIFLKKNKQTLQLAMYTEYSGS